MPNKNLCEIIVLLDRSGSMATVANDTVGGFGVFIEEQKKIPGDCVLTLVQFDSDSIETVHEAKQIKDIPTLVFVPRGGTPLLDAIGQTIVKTGKRFADMPEEKRPGKVIFQIITDGEENASREFDLAKVKALITEQTDKWKWEFGYIGANVDAFDEAGKMGIRAAGVASMSMDGDHYPETYRSMAASTGRSRTGGSLGYTLEERAAMDEKPQTAPATSDSTTAGNNTGT